MKKKLKEAVGVPTGIYDSAKKLYELISESINVLDDSHIEDEKNELDFEYDTNFQIADYVINNVNLTLEIIKTKKVNRISLLGMSFASKTRTEDAKLIPIIEDGKIDLKITYVITPKTDVQQLKDYFKNDRVEFITSLSHELKHSYDHFKTPVQSIYGTSKYITPRDVSTGVAPVNRFIYLLYYSHAAENLVRPSELYVRMEEHNVSAKEFYDFVTSSEMWEILNELSRWDYDDFKKELIPFSSQIKKFVQAINEKPFKENNDKLIDEFLKLVCIGIMNTMMGTANDLLVKTMIEQFLGLSGEKEELFNKIRKIASKFINNPNKFYKHEEEYFHKISYILKKKIGKLYSLTQ